MRPNEFARWVETARDAGATRIVCKRARRGGGADANVFLEERADGFDVESAVMRMRDDVLVSRRLPQGQFEVKAFAKDKEVMCERLNIRRDEDAADLQDTDPAGAMAQVATVALREMQSMARTVIDSNAGLRGAIGDFREVIKELTAQHTSTLEAMFEMAQLREQERAAIRASEDKRELGKQALAELGPVLGAALSKLGKSSGPALVAFLSSLSQEQMAAITGHLTQAQRASLGTVWEQVAKERGEAEKKTNHKAEA